MTLTVRDTPLDAAAVLEAAVPSLSHLFGCFVLVDSAENIQTHLCNIYVTL